MIKAVITFIIGNMITLICGEDVVRSREYLLGLQEEYKKKGYQVQHVLSSELQEVVGAASGSPDLFGRKQIFVAEHINKLITRKKSSGSLAAFLELIEKNKDVELLIWERLSLRDLKLKKIAATKEFKPSQNIFQLLDSCYPTNIKSFLTLLDKVTTPASEMFVFIMLARHLRALLLLKLGIRSESAAPWQAAKLGSQARLWSTEKLEGFYDGLYRIDSSLKNGSNPHGLKKSLDILACYFL